MSDDERRERVLAAVRAEIERLMVATERKQEATTRRLRDQLHALSACRAALRDLRQKPGRPKRRKAA